MAYQRNLSINQNNVVNISGSNITLTGSLTGSEFSGSRLQSTIVSASVVSASQYLGLNLTASVITGTELNIDYIDFVPQATEPSWLLGRVFYDGSGSLTAYTDVQDVGIDLGQQLMLRCHNDTGGPINKGTVVRLTTTTNNSDTPRIVTASWDDDASSAATLGVVVKTIPHTQNGYVILNGILTNIDTQGTTEGQILYLSSSGLTTTTVPVAPKHEVRVAQVVRVASNGTIFVRVQNGYEIEELHNVLVTNRQNGDLIVYDSGSTVWRNTKTLSGSYQITGNLDIAGNLSTQFFTSSEDAFFAKNIRVNGTASIALLNTINQTSLQLGDKYITILTGAADHASLDGSGILWGSGAFGDPTQDEFGANAHILYRTDPTDALEIFPKLVVGSGSNIVTVTSSSVSALTGTFNFLSSSNAQITGNLNGNATTATTATNVSITGESVNLNRHLVFAVLPSTSNQNLRVDSGGQLTYNPFTDVLTLNGTVSGTIGRFNNLTASSGVLTGTLVGTASDSNALGGVAASGYVTTANTQTILGAKTFSGTGTTVISSTGGLNITTATTISGTLTISAATTTFNNASALITGSNATIRVATVSGALGLSGSNIIGNTITGSSISASTYIGLPSATAAGSTGQIQFNTGSNVLGADSTFVWDNTNKRLGVGTVSPTYKLDISANTAGGVANFSNANAGGYAAADFTLAGTQRFSTGYCGAAQGLLQNNAYFYSQNSDLMIMVQDTSATSQRPSVTFKSAETVFNDNAQNINFRVESTSSQNMLLVDSALNRVGVNKTSPNSTLDVNGSTIISGNLTVTGSIAELSTRRIKTNIVSLNDELTTISKLNPVSYTRIDDGRREYGFISEEVKEVYPEFVVGEGINYPKMVSILVSAVKELTEKVENQSKEIQLLKNKKKRTIRGKK